MSDNAILLDRFAPKKRVYRMQRRADWGTSTLQNLLLSNGFRGFGANTNTSTVGFRVAAKNVGRNKRIEAG